MARTKMVVGRGIGACPMKMVWQFVRHPRHNAPMLGLWNAVRAKCPAGEEWLQMGVHLRITASQRNGPPIHRLTLCAQEYVRGIVAQMSCGVTMVWMKLVVGWACGACTTLTAPNLVQN